MGTRSAIGVMHGDVLKAVYCHWDGYLEHNGRILQEHYDSSRANNLVALGDISALRKEIGEKHSFSPLDSGMTTAEYDRLYGNMTTFYGRDREEKNVSWKVFHDYDSFYDHFEGAGAEYYYIMKDGVWYYSTCRNKTLRLLSESLKVAA
jgi:hypothetical protein